MWGSPIFHTNWTNEIFRWFAPLRARLFSRVDLFGAFGPGINDSHLLLLDMNLLDLPSDCLDYVFRFLNLRDVPNVARVSRKFAEHLTEDGFWRHMSAMVGIIIPDNCADVKLYARERLSLW